MYVYSYLSDRNLCIVTVLQSKLCNNFCDLKLGLGLNIKKVSELAT